MILESKNQTIAVIGANSMVGSRFCKLTKFNLIKADLNGENSIDITDKESVNKFFKNNNFDVAILFSAFTNVDTAETQRGNKNESCWQINVSGTQNVVLACKKYKCKSIFISTDFIFDGKNGPYTENDKPEGSSKKISWYGLTKMEAEKICEKNLDNYLILRISYPYRAKFPDKLDFAKQIIKKYDEKTLYPMFFDQSMSPTFIDDLAPAIDLLLTNNSKGIYHVASPQTVSPFEFAKYLVSVFNRDPQKIKKASIYDFLKMPNATPRPIKAGLKVDKISKEGFVPTSWQEGIQRIFEQSKGKLI